MIEQLTRLRCSDLWEAKVNMESGGDATIDQVIAALQAEMSRTFDCPKCLVNGNSSGWIELPTAGRIICDICLGYLKTEVQYIEDQNNPGHFIPQPEQPQEEE